MLICGRLIMVSLILALISITTIDAAHAGPLDDAKAQGLIGEKADGYVGAVTGDDSIQGMIDEINAGRRAKYAEIASKRDAPIEAVAAIAGKKLIERTPAGQYVMSGDGQWQRK
ncbi:MAG: YdbL family protein [Geminicoccaceae bacterium]